MSRKATTTDPEVYKQLQSAYKNKFGRSPSALISKLNNKFSAELQALRSRPYGSSRRDLISDKTIRTFFNADTPQSLMEKNLNYLVLALLGFESYAAARQAMEKSEVERLIEFPPEYREAGTSILSYFNHILNVKYPGQKIKVRIEQEDLLLRMIVETPSGQKELIERTLEEYGMVVVGRMLPEDFIDNPFEVIALKNKLEIAKMEVRQARELIKISQSQSQDDKAKVLSLEQQVHRLYDIVDKGLVGSNSALSVVKSISDSRPVVQQFNSPVGSVSAANNGVQKTIQHDHAKPHKLFDAAAKVQLILEKTSDSHLDKTVTDRLLIAKKALEVEENRSTLKKLMTELLQSGHGETLKELIEHPDGEAFVSLIADYTKVT